MRVHPLPLPAFLTQRLHGASSIKFPFGVFRTIRTTGRDLAVSIACVGERSVEGRQVVTMTGSIQGTALKLAVAVVNETDLDYREPIPVFLNFGQMGRSVYTAIEPGAERETIYDLLPLDARGDQVLPCGKGGRTEHIDRLDLIHQISARYGLGFIQARQFLSVRPQVLIDYSLGDLTLSRLASELSQYFPRRG